MLQHNNHVNTFKHRPAHTQSFTTYWFDFHDIYEQGKIRSIKEIRAYYYYIAKLPFKWYI